MDCRQTDIHDKAENIKVNLVRTTSSAGRVKTAAGRS